jgi:hypothetical protein
MRSSIGALHDRVGRAFQFVMQPALDKAAEYRIYRFVAVQGKARDIRRAVDAAHRPMHRLDDVAANREIAQLVLNARFEGPATGCNLLGNTETFQPGHPSDHQAAEFGVFA